MKSEENEKNKEETKKPMVDAQPSLQAHKKYENKIAVAENF